jgi:hypothetical protein
MDTVRQPVSDGVFVAYAADEPVEVLPGVLIWVRGIGKFDQGSGAVIRADAKYGSLAAMLSDLDGYIERRAEEKATPAIEEARQSVEDAQAGTEFARQRGDDLASELGRRLEALDRQNERLRRRVTELEASSGD